METVVKSTISGYITNIERELGWSHDRPEFYFLVKFYKIINDIHGEEITLQALHNYPAYRQLKIQLKGE